MPEQNPYDRLSRRERQILDIVLELKEATAKDVVERLPDPPSNSAARAMLVKLEAKGAISHFERSLRYVYTPAVSPKKVRNSAISRLVRVFYGGSVAHAVSGMVDMSADRMSEEELDEIAAKIENARQRRKSKPKKGKKSK